MHWAAIRPAQWAARHWASTDWLARWMQAEEGRFGLWLPVGAIAGDATFFSLRHDPPVWLAAILLLSGGAIAATRRSTPAYAAGLMAVLFGLGFGAAQLASWHAAPLIPLPAKAALIEGQVVGEDVLPDALRLDLAGARINAAPIGPRHLRMRVPLDAAGSTAGPGLGAIVALRGMVSPPNPPAYPGGRDLQRDAYFSGLGGSGYALGPLTVTSVAPADWLTAVRSRIAARVRRVLPGAPGAIAATLLSGLSGAIPPADRDAFRDAGLAHLLAIAGLHIGIVMGLALALTRGVLGRSEHAALFWPLRQISALCALAAGLAYLLLTGIHVPTLRSFAMAGLAVLALLAGRRALSLRSWGIAALAVIAISPEQVTGAGFQLSFAAVLALIAGYEVLRGPLNTLRGTGSGPRRAAHHAATLGLTSVLAGTASLPFIAYHFGHIQLYFVLANLIAVPLTALWVMPAGLCALVLMPLGLDSVALIPMGWGLRIILWIAHWVAALPAATLAVPHLPMAALLAMAMGLAWLCLWRSGLRLLGVGAVAGGILIAVCTAPPQLLLSANGRLIGLSAPHALYVQTTRGGDGFTQDAWTQYLGRLPRAMPRQLWTDAGSASLRCVGHACVGFGDADTPCGAFALLIVPSGAAPYCPGAAVLDRGDTWRDGAVAVWLHAAPRVVTDRQRRGDRPWVFLPPEQERAAIDLPMAQADPLDGRRGR